MRAALLTNSCREAAATPEVTTFMARRIGTITSRQIEWWRADLRGIALRFSLWLVALRDHVPKGHLHHVSAARGLTLARDPEGGREQLVAFFRRPLFC